MGFLSNITHRKESVTASPQSEVTDPEKHGADEDNTPVKFLTLRTFFMGVLVSMGGFIFGYDTGSISGYLLMKDFMRRFAEYNEHTHEYYFTNVRKGVIVGLLSVGTLIGSLVSAPLADRFGRKWSICGWVVIYCVGVVVQISSEHHWYQVPIGRMVAGFGVGALSVLVPMYQSESAPRHVRGALVSCFQLFVTLGIFVAYCIDYGTETKDNASSWRIPMGCGYIWACILGFGIILFPESPRYAYRKGDIEGARRTMARLYGVDIHHREIEAEMKEIKDKLDAERAGGDRPWHEFFTGPAMMYRTLLGIALQMFQQLTGANFFFYYGATIFQATGLNNSYVTQMILGAVNFGTTFGGLYVVEKFGRRKALIVGGAWMFICLIIFASIGHFALDLNHPQSTPKTGSAMIVFACLFICGYAMTWGPIIWAIIGELYPSQYRAKCMSIATASNWLWNFLIAFFTPFITSAIDYRYGYVFAGATFAAICTVFFFVQEGKGKTLEEIDTMYITGVPAWKSESWVPPPADELVTTDRISADMGGFSTFKKVKESGNAGTADHTAEAGEGATVEA
ncbi:MAG: hypothetical protein M1819_004374 [Sarea resinae]|nr:MAG: hypothetical protein M1819_004374 [Sarea resinae]